MCPTIFEFMIDRDIPDLTILAEPSEVPHRFGLHEIDPAELADFNEANAGPITGGAARV